MAGSRRGLVVGIGGPSCAGKTTLAQTVAARIASCVVVCADNYYRDLGHLTVSDREGMNFDSPDAIEWELLARDLAVLRAGGAVDVPRYDFAIHTRLEGGVRVGPAEVIVVEGLFVLHWPEVRGQLDFGVYLETGGGEALRRRVARDVSERARNEADVRRQYESTVAPMAEAYVLPSRAYADVIVNGEAPGDDGLRTILDWLAARG